MTDVGTLNPLPQSFAEWINSREQVVGFTASFDFATQAAFLWEHGGPVVDLNSLITPGSDLDVRFASNINDRGEISCEGATSNGDIHACLLIPCDENHRGMEDCDYSLVEPTAAAQRGVQLDFPSETQRPPQSRRTNRYHLPGLQSLGR
jgi:hypothetical protein